MGCRSIVDPWAPTIYVLETPCRHATIYSRTRSSRCDWLPQKRWSRVAEEGLSRTCGTEKCYHISGACTEEHFALSEIPKSARRRRNYSDYNTVCIPYRGTLHTDYHSGKATRRAVLEITLICSAESAG